MKIFNCIFFLLLSLNAQSQNDLFDFERSIFDKAETIQFASNYFPATFKDSIKDNVSKEITKDLLKSSLEIYEQLLDSFPNSRFRYKAIFNKAEINYNLRNFTLAKNDFLTILNTQTRLNYQNSNQDNYHRKRAAYRLVEIEIESKNYENAVQLLEEGKKIRIQRLCATEYEEERDYYEKTLKKCKDKLKTN